MFNNVKCLIAYFKYVLTTKKLLMIKKKKISLFSFPKQLIYNFSILSGATISCRTSRRSGPATRTRTLHTSGTRLVRCNHFSTVEYSTVQYGIAARIITHPTSGIRSVQYYIQCIRVLCRKVQYSTVS